MADLSEFAALAKPKKGRCPLAGLDLSKPDTGSLKAALAADPLDISAGAITRWLKLRGHEINQQRVNSHRRGTCSCND